jgi:hypothetical protein
MAYDEEDDDKKPKRAVIQARKGEGRMGDLDFQQLIKGAIEESVSYVDTQLSPVRAKATDRYLGAPLGNEEEGRSQVVLTEVRDAVLGVMPSVLRVFFGSENVVEYLPTRADNVAQAEQATDYVRYVFEQDNPGFLNTLSVLKDGLVRKIGIFHWAVDDSESTKAYRQENLSREQLELLAEDDDITFTEIKERPIEPDEAPPEPSQPKMTDVPDGKKVAAVPDMASEQIMLYDVEFTRYEKRNRIKIWTLPPEEFIFNRQARSIEEALFVGRRSWQTRGDLKAMGVSQKILDQCSGDESKLVYNPEEIARLEASGAPSGLGSSTSVDPFLGESNDRLPYVELYISMDFDGDGENELRKVCCVGYRYLVVSNTPASQKPFSIFCPDPEPHVLIGQSWDDRLADMQIIASSLLRGGLDSLSASIFPRMAILDGQVNIGDVMNTAIGAPLRERISGAARPLVVPFTGKDAMPMLDFVHDTVERRTGQNKGVLGLDADALQSTDAAGVQAAISASQAQAEMLCRLLAEMALKPLFKGVLQLLVETQPRERIIRLRGKMVPIDPRQWDANMDATVNVGLGSAFIEKKVATLMGIYAQQKEIITTYGPNNPLVTLAMLSRTVRRIIELQGLKNATDYFMEVAPDWQLPPAPPEKSPEQIIAEAQVEAQKLKTTGELAIQKDKLALEEKRMMLEHEYRMQQLDYQMLKLHTDDETKRDTTTETNVTKVQTAEIAADTSDDHKEAELALAAHDQVHRHDMNRRAADLAESTAADAASSPEDSAE